MIGKHPFNLIFENTVINQAKKNLQDMKYFLQGDVLEQTDTNIIDVKSTTAAKTCCTLGGICFYGFIFFSVFRRMSCSPCLYGIIVIYSELYSFSQCSISISGLVQYVIHGVEARCWLVFYVLCTVFAAEALESKTNFPPGTMKSFWFWNANPEHLHVRSRICFTFSNLKI